MRRFGGLTVCLVVLLAIAAGGASSAMATSFGASAWGENAFGELGNGAKSNSAIPVVVSGLAEVAAVAGGENFSLALLSNGKVMSWGGNELGQLGNGSTKASNLPVAVSGLSEVTAIAAGRHTGYALLSNGTVMAWGAGSSGQLGNGTTAEKSTTPVAVSELGGVTAIAAGESHALALLSSGKAKSWGDNQSGELGDGTTTGSDVPVSVSALSEAAAVSAGGTVSAALLSNGTVRTWGNNEHGALGIGTTSGPDECIGQVPVGEFEFEEVPISCSKTPVEVGGLSEVSAIAVGGFGTTFAGNTQVDVLALLSGGTVKSWGSNNVGQLGDGTQTERDAPVTVSGLSEVAAIATGGIGRSGGSAVHSLALLGSGVVKSWGANQYGQLGDGTTTKRLAPVTAGTAEVAGIAAAGAHSLAYGTPGPAVAELKPTAGTSKGGTSVEIIGSGFTGATQVKFDAASATFEYVSPTKLIATSPAETPRTADVTVRTPIATSAISAADQFKYLPEGTIDIGRCVKVAAGKGAFKTGSCTETMAAGNWEWLPGFVKPAFTDSGSAATLETVGKASLACTLLSGSGEYSGQREVTGIVLTFSGCELAGAKCSSAGAGTGEIVSGTLEGGLGWRERPTNKVGLDLFPLGEAGPFLEATCGGATIVVRGSVIAQITPVNNRSTTFALKFKQSKGKQTTEHFEGEANDVLEASISGGAYEQAGLALEVTQTNEEELEINTVV